MPDDRLESLRVRGDGLRIDGRNNHAGIRDPRGMAAVAAQYSDDFCAHGLGVVGRGDQIRADVLFGAAAAHRQNEYRIACS